jgi:hypothetical protein
MLGLLGIERINMTKEIEKLAEALDDIVRAAGTWQEKKNKILETLTEDEKTNLYEFIAWFE